MVNKINIAKNNKEIKYQNKKEKKEGKMKHQQADHIFHLKKGRMIMTLADLMEFLKDMSNDEFLHHVNNQKNDFAAWTEQSLHNRDLSNKMKYTKTKTSLLRLLEKELDHAENKEGFEIPEHAEQALEVKDSTKTTHTVIHQIMPQISPEHAKFIIKEFVYGLVFGLILGLIIGRLIFFSG